MTLYYDDLNLCGITSLQILSIRETPSSSLKVFQLLANLNSWPYPLGLALQLVGTKIYSLSLEKGITQ